METPDPDSLIEPILHAARATRRLVGRVFGLSFPTENPRKLARITAGIASGIEDLVISAQRTGRASGKAWRTEAQLIVRLLHRNAAELRFAERATTHNTPWSLVRPLEKLASQLHPDCDFIIRPQWSYNYTIEEISNSYRRRTSHLLASDILEKLVPETRRLYVIGFPVLERRSILLHAIFGHELGHPIERNYRVDDPERPVYFAEIKRLAHAEIKANAPQGQLSLDDYARLQKMVDNVDQLRARAVAELICDLVGIHLFGPAALFASEQLAQSSDLDTFESESHLEHYPPWRFRLRVMCGVVSQPWLDKFLAEGKFRPAVIETVRRKHRQILDIVAATPDEDNLRKNPETAIAYRLVNNALPALNTFVSETLRDKGIKLDDLIHPMNGALVDRLQEWIPPNECLVTPAGNDQICPRVSANIRLILNAGWAHRINLRTESPIFTPEKTEGEQREQMDSYFDELDTLDRLILRAIEYADLQVAWGEYQETG